MARKHLENEFETMFRGADFTGCRFDDFDTSNVDKNCNFENMFRGADFTGCRFDNFDTSNADTRNMSPRNMEAMFSGCKFPDGFTFGDKFNTSNV